MELFMSDAEIATHFRQAANKQKDLKILAELNSCQVIEIKAALAREGIVLENRQKKLDGVAARKLYEQGCNDRKIATELNVSPSTVTNWRLRNALPSVRKKQGSQGTDKTIKEITRACAYEITKRVLALVPQDASEKVKSCAVEMICALFMDEVENITEEVMPHDISEH